MTLEQQVTSLEISKRLKELGVKQESYFWWNIDEVDTEVNPWKSDLGEQVSAFTVAELGEMLPRLYYTNRKKTVWNLAIWKSEGHWYVDYNPYTNEEKFMGPNRKFLGKKQEVGDTEANARGKTLIYLLENKLMKENV